MSASLVRFFFIFFFVTAFLNMFCSFNTYKLQCSSLNSNSRGPTKFVLIMRCSNYEFALNIKCEYNGLSRDNNHLSELMLIPELTEPE